MSIFDRALHIPAEPLLFGARRAPHERVLLPLAARPSPRFYGAVLLSAFGAFACLCLGVAMTAVGGGGSLLFASGFLVASVLPAGIAIVGVVDAMRAMPLLVIEAEGLRDRRLGGDRIAWSRIVGAELVASTNGIQAVRLALAEEAPPRFNPLRLGGFSADWRSRRHSRTIALTLLDVRAHVLAHTILALAARNGATVDPLATQTIV